MRVEMPELGGAGDTLLAVVLGALLATLGGFAASRLEAYLRRRERERDAALLFGEILATLRIILRMAVDARGRGDPYGPITMRMLRAARREIEIYDRNRERLFDLTEGLLRIKTHSLVVSITMSLDGILETTQRMAMLADNAAGRAQMATAVLERDRGFDFIVETLSDFEPLTARLGVLARTSFAGHEAVVLDQASPGP